ncbi:MAG: D-glycerate dehydrogenase [Dehalococcoidia bacterium]|nr:D-glycerate dehydrogenase [Dehalococcoidia bacterium]
MGQVFITRVIPGTAVETLREAGHEVEVWPEAGPPPPDVLAARLAAADAAMTMVVDRVTPSMLDTAPRLKVLANMAVGYDNIDPAEAAKRGVRVTNTPGVLAETTADMAFALLMAAARNVVASDRDTRAGGWTTWSPTGFLGQDVFGATLGIVGLGEIGEAMARRALGFRMRVVYTSRTGKPEAEARFGCRFVELDELLAQSDFVSLHVPLNGSTRGMIGARELRLMKTSAILVNTARGQVVDQGALIAALRDGVIGGAALDVTDPEPLPLEDPLYTFSNVIITPHIASASLATRAKMAEMAAANIIAVLAGQAPINPVN